MRFTMHCRVGLVALVGTPVLIATSTSACASQATALASNSKASLVIGSVERVDVDSSATAGSISIRLSGAGPNATGRAIVDFTRATTIANAAGVRLRATEIQPGSTIKAWTSHAILLSDPPIINADSVRVSTGSP